MSRTIANSILRIDSAARAQWLWPLMIEILVTPWTRLATSLPNVSVISSSVESVSSTTSCSRAATTVAVSSRVSTRMAATSRGWMMNGSPEARNCPEWRALAQRAAATILRRASSSYSSPAASSRSQKRFTSRREAAVTRG